MYKPEDSRWLNCTCDVCGKKFHRKPSQIALRAGHYCSLKCHYQAKKTYMQGEGNHQFGLKGRANATWKSDIRKTSLGYIQIRKLDHPFRDKAGFVFEHRLVAEEYLLTAENSVEIGGKRYLKPEYVVHHKNFDRQDNRHENLAVMTHAEHQALHLRLNHNRRDKHGQFKKDEPESVKVKRVTETAIVPERQSVGAAGFDLCADISEPVVIAPHSTEIVFSGIAFSIPRDYFGAIYARSGRAIKNGLRPATCVSIIDSDYRGNVGLPIHNDSDSEQIVQPQERIAQIVFQRAIPVTLKLVNELDVTERGSNGFGSTGR